MTDKKTIREGAAVTENESVERLALAMYRGAGMEQTVSWTVNAESNREEWRGLARIALTSHPAVDALRRLVESMSEVWVDDETTEPEELRKYEDAHTHALAVLASLPKEK